MEQVLTADGLEKTYRRRKVVDGVSFEVFPGEIVGLLGPNGAGKSTSFHMVAGLIPCERGAVSILGKPAGKTPLHGRARMGLGYLPQESTIFRGLTVEDNFSVYFEAKGIGKAERKQRIAELLEQYQLTRIAANLGSQLSGGERRRVEMARCLIPEPKIVLLDEPFAGVDPIAVKEIKKFIEMMKAEGLGVLLTDHNVRETLKICDRAYLIFDGRILVQGTPEEVVKNELARERYLGEDFSLS